MSYINNDQRYREAFHGEPGQERNALGVSRREQQIVVRQANADETQAIRLLWFFAAATSLVMSMALARLFL